MQKEIKRKVPIKKNSITLDLILMIITLGIWAIFIITRQLVDICEIIPPDTTKELPSPSKLLILSIFTFGIYYLLFDFYKIRYLHKYIDGEYDLVIELFFLFMNLTIAFFSLSIIYTQLKLNKYVSEKSKPLIVFDRK